MNKNEITKEKGASEESFFDLAKSAIESLSDRSREIIMKRFGLHEGEAKTLDAIGKEYKITRERVRQIISDSIRRISKNENVKTKFDKAQIKIVLEINAKSGIIKQSEILFKLSGGDPKEKNAVAFFANCIKNIKISELKGIIEKVWVISEDMLEKIKETHDVAIQVLEEHKSPVEKKELVEKVSKKNLGASKKEVEDFLEVLLAISQNKFGKWGMTTWPEIKPKSAKDKIYLVLKEFGNPLHFSQIAKKIDEHGLSKKKAHPQTIHNELIKDNRFVLIGRGIYALAEWGYSKGTVREVIKEILKEKGPLDKDAILNEVSKIRKVKKETVVINLNNPKFFIREGNLYKVK